jgi:hypothetical protein
MNMIPDVGPFGKISFGQNKAVVDNNKLNKHNVTQLLNGINK